MPAHSLTDTRLTVLSAEPVDLTESPWGYNEGHDEQQPLPTHFRKEERRLTYDQGATPFDDSEVTRRSWWHPKGQTEVVGENFDQPLPRSGFVDTRYAPSPSAALSPGVVLSVVSRKQCRGR